MFTKIDDDHFRLVGEKKDNIFPSLDEKVYTLDLQRSFFGISYIFSPMTRYENAKVSKAGIFKEVYNYTKGFFNSNRTKLRKEMGFVNKMNLILKGEPGTGKTHLACTVANELVKEHKGLGIVMNDIDDVEFDKLIDKIRINEPDRLLIFVLDELEKNSRGNLRNPNFLAFLDGAKSRENVIIIATVNSIQDFPNFLIKRPGRFEKVFDFVFNTEDTLSELTKELIPERYSSNKEVVDDIVMGALISKIKTIDELRFYILNYLVAYENGEILEPVKKETAVVVEELKVDDESAEKFSEETLLDTLTAAINPN